MATFGKENPKLELFETTSRGRGIRTKDTFLPGSTILSCLPYLFVSRSDLQGKICDSCLRVENDLQRCCSCKFVYYCGKSCQKKAWSVHKLECKYLKKMYPNIPGDTVRLIALIILKNTDHEFLQYLTSHCSEMRHEKSEMFGHILTMLRKYFKISDNNEMIFDIFCKVHCNAFTISDDEMKPTGLGLYIASSFINHSCHPNSVATFLGTTCSIQAIEGLKYGDEVCISYTELLRPCYIRRRELKQQYFFECHCLHCEEEEASGSFMHALKCIKCLNIVGMLPGHIESTCDACGSEIASYNTSVFISKLNTKIDILLASLKDTQTERDNLESCERLLSDVEMFLPPMNYQVVKIVDKASDLCIEMGLWSKALYYCKKSLLAYQQLYPQYHPSIGLQLYRIGKLEIYLDTLDPGLQSLSEAKRVLNICHGKTHPLCLKLDELLFKTAEEKQFLSVTEPNTRTQLSSH